MNKKNIINKGYQKGRAWIEISRTALKLNVSALKGLLGENLRIMPAVKANAYGHGAVIISKELQALGIFDFCVATAEEGAELRREGIKGNILVLGYTHPCNFDLLKKNNLIQAIVSYEYAIELNNSPYKMLKTHLAIDTGMHRIGLSLSDREKILEVYQLKNISVVGIFSHLCVADSESSESVDFSTKQIKAFTDLLVFLKENGIDYKDAHIQSSFGILNYNSPMINLARPGIAMYGLLGTSSDYLKHGTPLYPVLSLKTRIICLREIPKDDGLGYGLAFTAKRNTKVAVLAIGYADGLPRALSCGVGNAIVKGKKVPIIGRICMDLCFIDVTDVKDVQVGNIVTLIGKDGEEEISAVSIAEKTNTISYEIVSTLGKRLHRIIN